MATITLNHITKVEGHARLDLKIENNKVKKCELGSIEGSRYFEGLLKGRKWIEAHEITTRICGICSSAHNVAAIMAIENALNVASSKQTIALMQLQTIGERIRSHTAHLYFLALPDYLGYESAIAMAPKFKKEIQAALRLLKLGNDLVALTTGRAIHPVAPTIGGFLHFPAQEDLDEIRKRLDNSHQDIITTNQLISALKFPDFQRPTQYMCIVKNDEFGTSHGHIMIGNKTYAQSQFHDFIEEYHEPFSTANFAVREGKSYSVGALARFNNNKEKLSKETKQYMKKIEIKFPSN